jgi:phosphoadenosine phosphosulfate reductase
MISELHESKLQAKLEAARDGISVALSRHSDACFTCSFQAEDMVVLHLVRDRQPAIPVLFLETGYHFDEVYRYRDEMTARLGLNLVNVQPRKTVEQQEAEFGKLYRSQPDQCCKLRKVGPLFAALENYHVWFTGLRRVQSSTRTNLQVHDSFTLPSGKAIDKISPLADWTDRDVWIFAKRIGVRLLPLYREGYTSIGCEPCTAKPSDAANPRSGRWAGQKLECGIHLSPRH